MPDAVGPDVTVVVLTGGRSSRMGQDKASLPIADLTMLERVLQAVPAGVPCIIAGPHESDRDGVTVVREDRPFGGPASGLSTAMPIVRTPYAVVCAVDMPFALPHVLPLVARLSSSDADAVLPVDAAGRQQMLAGAYRTHALLEALARLDDPFGRPLRDVVSQLRVLEVSGLYEGALTDIDTPNDAASAKALIDEDGSLA